MQCLNCGKFTKINQVETRNGYTIRQRGCTCGAKLQTLQNGGGEVIDCLLFDSDAPIAPKEERIVTLKALIVTAEEYGMNKRLQALFERVRIKTGISRLDQ